MSGIFSTLNVANRGLQAQQTALQTTSHNISNANTEGYSRQRVELTASRAYNFAGVGQLGTGVTMESIVRVVNDYVTNQIRQENSTLNRYATKSEVLEHLEIIFNEPSDTGLNFNLGEMFASWQELSKNPESLNFKTIVYEKSRTLAETINHMGNQINNLRDNTIGQIQKNALDFNSMISQLESLNSQIYHISSSGQIPNDLLDQRDLLLKNLSSIIDFKADFDKYGRANIMIDGQNITSDNLEISVITKIEKNENDEYTVYVSKRGDSLSDPFTYTTTEIGDLKVGQIVLNNREEIKEDEIITNVKINNGQILGNMEALDEIRERKDELNTFTENLVEQINTAHKEGDYKGDFFVFEEDREISDSIMVNSEFKTNPDKINAGKPGSEEGDGTLALRIAQLRNKKSDSGTTIEGAYRDIVIKIGISKEYADNKVSNQEVLVNQLELRRESSSGVSIDEEVTNLIKYQKSYEANAKVIAVLSEMLDTLINRMGV